MQKQHMNHRYDGSSIESFARILVGMGEKDNGSLGPNMPKRRAGKRPGRNAVYRLGSDDSSLSSKVPPKCEFC